MVRRCAIGPPDLRSARSTRVKGEPWVAHDRLKASDKRNATARRATCSRPSGAPSASSKNRNAQSPKPAKTPTSLASCPGLSPGVMKTRTSRTRAGIPIRRTRAETARRASRAAMPLPRSNDCGRRSRSARGSRRPRRWRWGFDSAGSEPGSTAKQLRRHDDVAANLRQWKCKKSAR